MTTVCPLCGAKPQSTMVDHSLRLVSRCPDPECRVVQWWSLDELIVASMRPAEVTT